MSEPAEPCPSRLLWQINKPHDTDLDYVDVICEEADVVIVSNLSWCQARAVVAAHNGSIPQS